MAPLTTYSDKDLGVTFKYPANQASTFLVSKQHALVHALLREECGGKNVHMKLTIERTNELYSDIYDQKFNDMMISEIIQSEIPDDITEEELLAIKECVHSEVITLQGPGAFKAWYMTVVSDQDTKQLASFAMVIPVENNRSYRITCYPPEDEAGVAIKEQQVLADLSKDKKPTDAQTETEAAAAPAAAVVAAVPEGEQKQETTAAAAAPALTEAERRKEKKDRKKKQQAEERLFKEARAIIESMVFLPEYTRLEQESTWTIEPSNTGFGIKMLLPSFIYTTQRRNEQDADAPFVAQSNGNTPHRKSQVKVSFLNSQSSQRAKEMVQEEQEKLKAQGMNTTAVSVTGNNAAISDAFSYEAQIEQDGKKLPEYHLVCFAPYKNSKLARIEFSDGLQIRSKAQFVELCQRCMASLRVATVAARAESASFVTYRNLSHGFEVDVRKDGAELHEGSLSPINIVFDDEATRGRVETSIAFYSLPPVLKQFVQQTKKPLTSKELLDLLKRNLSQRIPDIQTFHIVEENDGNVLQSGVALPTCNLHLTRYQTVYTPDYKQQYDLYIVVNILCTSTMCRNIAGEWRVCTVMTARMDQVNKQTLAERRSNWFPQTIKDLHKSVRFFEPKASFYLPPAVFPVMQRPESKAVEGSEQQPAAEQAVAPVAGKDE